MVSLPKDPDDVLARFQQAFADRDADEIGVELDEENAVHSSIPGPGGPSGESASSDPPPAADPPPSADPNPLQMLRPEAALADDGHRHGGVALGPRRSLDSLPVRHGTSDEVLAFIKFKPQHRDMIVKCPKHQNCSKTRSCNQSAKFPQQGRPLGFLAAWASAADQYPTKESHFKDCVPSKAERREARRRLLAEDASDAFFARERVPRTGEDSEPDVCP